MKNLLKKIALMLTLIIGTTSIPTFANTKTIETTNKEIITEEITLNKSDKEITNNIEERNPFQSEIKDYDNNNNTNQRKLGPTIVKVLVYVGNILVGWIVDGIVIKASGQSGGEWVAKALDFHRRNPNVTSIHISSSGKVHGGNGRPF